MASFSGKVYGGTLAHRINPPNGTNQGSIPDNYSLAVYTLAANDPYYSSYRNEWFTTTYNGKNGYVMAKWIAITAGGATGTITTATDPLNIRESPSSSAAVIYTTAKGSVVRVLDTTAQSGFYRVSCSKGTGWGSNSVYFR